MDEPAVRAQLAEADITVGPVHRNLPTPELIARSLARGLLKAALEGSLDGALMTRHPVFGVEVPSVCQGVSDQLPAENCAANFECFAGRVPPEVAAAGPSAAS